MTSQLMEKRPWRGGYCNYFIISEFLKGKKKAKSNFLWEDSKTNPHSHGHSQVEKTRTRQGRQIPSPAFWSWGHSSVKWREWKQPLLCLEQNGMMDTWYSWILLSGSALFLLPGAPSGPSEYRHWQHLPRIPANYYRNHPADLSLLCFIIFIIIY